MVLRGWALSHGRGTPVIAGPFLTSGCKVFLILLVQVVSVLQRFRILHSFKSLENPQTGIRKGADNYLKLSTGVLCLSETATPKDPTVGPCSGSYGGPRGAFYCGQGTPVPLTLGRRRVTCFPPCISRQIEEGIYEAIWKREFKLSWGKAGLPKSSR